MKILFIKPKLSSNTLGGMDYSICEPLEFETLAAGLLDHDIRILDLRFDPDLKGQIERFKPDIVGTTSMSVNVYAARNILRKVKSIDPAITTIVGGYHATVAPEDFAEPYIDAIVIGQGVDTLRDAVRALEADRGLESVPGLAIPAGSGVVKRTAKRGKVFDLDSQPIPVRTFNPHHRKYYFCEYWQPCAIMRASIGCHARCSFCALWDLTDGKYLTHTVNRVVDEIQSIPEKYVFFNDDNFMPRGHEKRVLEIRDEILRRGIDKEYYFSTRTDMVLARPDIIEKWVDAGLRRVFFGLEANDNDRLKSLNKGLSEDINLKAIKICHANGIAITGCFIVDPSFTREDFLRLTEYAARINLNIVAFLVLTPHPGTILHAVRRHEIIHPNYELWDHMHSVFRTNLPEKEFYREYAKLWMRSYTPMTWDGAKRAGRMLRLSSAAQKLHLCRTVVSIFPKIALGAAGHGANAAANWMNWALGRKFERVARGRSHPLLPSLRPESLALLTEENMNTEYFDDEKKRLISNAREMDKNVKPAAAF